MCTYLNINNNILIIIIKLPRTLLRYLFVLLIISTYVFDYKGKNVLGFPEKL